MAKIVIDAGHGGSDPGTSANGIVEKDYTLKISNYMKKRFDELGIPVSITRSTDETLDASLRTKKIQSFYGNGNDVIVISNHINAGGGDGAEVIYALRNNSRLSNKISEEIEKSGQNVRKNYQRRLPTNPSKDYYYVIRDTNNNETVIVEYGFADSTLDDVNQIKNNWEKLAEAVVKAVTEYIGENYKPIDGEEYYIVKKGDTLYGIANKFGIKVNDLKEYNKLKNNTLTIGQYLKIPKEDISNEVKKNYYTVKAGDTLWSIAKNNNITVTELKNMNNLTSNALSIGQKLIINTNNIIDDSASYYIVKKGDTLYQIAKKYNTTPEEIKKQNNLISNNLSIGQKLIINNLNTEYIVKKGDTLYQIAKKYNTTPEEIKKQNNLTSNNLSIGQKLLIKY